METKKGPAAIADFYKERQQEEVKAFRKENQVVLSKLGIDLADLSPEADKLLTKMATYQNVLDVKQLDDVSVYLWYSEVMSEEMRYKRLILEMEQNIRKRERENAKDRKELDKFRDELNAAKKKVQSWPSSEEMQKDIIAMQMKTEKYEKMYADVKGKLANLEIKPEIWPESLKSLIDELNTLKVERDRWRATAESISITRNAKKDLQKLKVTTNIV